MRLWGLNIKMIKSNIEDKIGHLLSLTFPLLKVERYKVVIYRNSRLIFDYYMPEFNLIIEVQGQQHTSWVKFFHNTVDRFRDQKYRDQLKTEWCKENNKHLLYFNYDEVPNITMESIRYLVLNKVRG